MLELDSSTPAKFSRHLIIRIPGAAFASNAHAGALVLQLCAGARARRGEDPRCALLVVRKVGQEGAWQKLGAGIRHGCAAASCAGAQRQQPHHIRHRGWR